MCNLFPDPLEPPFVFGRLAEGAYFTDRTSEKQQLMNHFGLGSHTILISPRRWGKSSLVNKAAQAFQSQHKNFRFCFIDLFSARSENHFYQLLAKEVLRSTSAKWEDTMENAKRFLGRLIPSVSFRPGHEGEFDLSLNWKEVSQRPDEIVDLAENVAKKKKIKIIICIDEFQNIKTFENPLAFQKILRSHWQKHQRVTYCLYGSKKNMMIEVFSSPEMPFYKFGELIFLQKIKEEDWVPYLVERFSSTGKKIQKADALHLARKVECHPHYVQQLAQQSWLRTKRDCSQDIIDDGAEGILLQLSLLFQNITDSLTSAQINFLHALLEGIVQFSAQQVLHDYDLGTSANILRIKDALVNKEILDITGKKLEFLDPFYKLWLNTNYFNLA